MASGKGWEGGGGLDRLRLLGAFQGSSVAVIARVLALAALGLWSLPAAAAEPVRQPTGKWLVEFAENECLLSRSYGTEKQPLIVAFAQVPMMSGIQILVLKKSNWRDMANGKARVGFSEGIAIETNYGAALLSDRMTRRISLTIEDESYKAAAKTELLSLSVPRELDERFALPGFGKALTVLRDCVVDLGKHWGIPAEQQARLARPAKSLTPLHKYFDPDDYPNQALRKGVSGQALVRIAIDEAGMPTDCVRLRTSKDEALDETTCRVLLKRARFEPAVDVGGKPMKSVAVFRVNWVVN